MPSEMQAFYLRQAKRAMAHVKEKLPYGASNKDFVPSIQARNPTPEQRKEIEAEEKAHEEQQKSARLGVTSARTAWVADTSPYHHHHSKRGWKELTTDEKASEKARGEERSAMVGKVAARMGVVHGAGNCGEQAKLAFEYLRGLGVSPLDFFAYDPKKRDHAWVVIGRPADANTRWIEKRWRNAVICDPWDNKCVTAVVGDEENPAADMDKRVEFVLLERWAGQAQGFTLETVSQLPKKYQKKKYDFD